MRIKHSLSIDSKEPTKNLGRSAAGFSLIEVLVVIAIIVILFAVGVPLLSDPANSARKSSADILRATLQQARAHSIATGAYTSVLLPSYSSDPEFGGRLIGFAEVVADPAAPSKYRITRLVQRWTQLPEQIYFMDRSAVRIPQTTLMDQGATPSINAEYRKRQIACNFIVFAPNGQILQNSTSTANPGLIVSLGKGTLRNGIVTPTQRNSQGIVFDLFQISRLSARVRQIDPQL
jgi:prepilin-type N-terminal cleavage/methylation domain-containing protein